MKVILGIAALLAAASASAQVHVDGHIRKDGTYVPPHVRSAPNSTTRDNWSTQGNYNPYTGQQGTQAPAPQPYQWRPVQTPQQPSQRTAPAAPTCPQGAFYC